MGKCVKCGKHGLFLHVTKEGLCAECEKAVELEKQEMQRRLEEEKIEQERREQERKAIIEAQNAEYERKLQSHKDMIESIKECLLSVDSEPAKIILSKDQVPITYSNITKKTPRDKLGNFVAIDTETTGLRPSSCEIIDIAAVRFRDYVPVEKVSMLLSSNKPIPADATKINGITDEMVAGQPRFQQVAQSLVEFIGNDNIVGHNLSFDLSFIIRYGADVTQQKRKYYDTLEIAKKTIKKARMKWDRELECYMPDLDGCGISNYQLGTLCSWYGIINLQSHRAEGDAIAAGLLLKKLADNRK